MAITPFRFKENDLIDNLKNQLNLSLKEKESVVELWRTSMTRIDYLENELKIYSAGSDNVNKTLIRKLKKTYENEVRNLRDKLKDSSHKLQEANTFSKTSLEGKKDELEYLIKSEQQSQEKNAKLEQELNEMLTRINDTATINESLKDDIAKEKIQVEKFKQESYDSKLKVAEACRVIEAALIEKDAALLREKEAVDEVAKLSTTIKEIIQETETKVKMEIHRVKEDCANKLHSYKLDVKKCQEDLSIKTLEFERKNEYCKQLETEIEALNEGKSKVLKNVTKEKQVWSGKVEQNKEKLQTSERKNSQLKQQLKQLINAIEKQKEHHNDEVCTLEIEKKNLETQIHTLENELQLSNSRFHQVTAKVDDLGRRMSSMDLQFKEELALKNSECERILTERLNEVECVNARINEELKAQLSAQINLNQKWKCEVRNVTEKLESRIRSMKNELIRLRSKNADLLRRLEHAERKRLEYKDNLKTLCTEFNSLANTNMP